MDQFTVNGFAVDSAGNVNAAVITCTGITNSGGVSGTTGVFSGAVSGTTGTFTSHVVGVNGTFSGAVSGTTGTFSSHVVGVNGTFSGAVSGAAGTFSGLLTSAGRRRARRAVAGDATLAATDDILAITSTASARAVTLPAAASVPDGQVFTVKDESLLAGTNNITLNRAGADLFQGAATYVISTNGGLVNFYSNGVDAWFTC